MRKLILLLGLIVLSCSVESEFEIQELNSDLSGISIKGSKNDKITICHFDADNNEWKTLNISQNAMPAHLNHGDAIDADGDGFFDRLLNAFVYAFPIAVISAFTMAPLVRPLVNKIASKD